MNARVTGDSDRPIRVTKPIGRDKLGRCKGTATRASFLIRASASRGSAVTPKPAATSAPLAAILGYSNAGTTCRPFCRKAASVIGRMLLLKPLAMKGRDVNNDQDTDDRSARGSSRRQSRTKG